MSDNITLVTETCQFCKWFERPSTKYWDGICGKAESANGSPLDTFTTACAFGTDDCSAWLCVKFNHHCNQWHMKE